MSVDKNENEPTRVSLRPDEIQGARKQVSTMEALEPFQNLLRFLNTHIKANKDNSTITFNISKLQSVIPTRTDMRSLSNSFSNSSKRLSEDNDSNRCNNDGDPYRNDSDSDDAAVFDCQAD